MLRLAVARQAHLTAAWMELGFVHGMLNTDNILVGGESIDLATSGFTPNLAPQTVMSSLDRDGRYAFGRQPEMVRWGLARLAETLLPLLDADQSQAVAMAEAELEAFDVVQSQRKDHSDPAVF